MITMQAPILLSLLLLFTTSSAQNNNNNNPQNSNNYQCDYSNDGCRVDWQMDGECDSAFNLYGCLNNDCWDCDPCRNYDWNCEACTNADCHWCPGDGVCRSQALPAVFWERKGVTSACAGGAEEWTQTCAPVHDDNVFGDPLYDAMKWSYDLIRIEEVWRQGITGEGVHVRVNDIGLDAHHAEIASRFDWDSSCASFVSQTDHNAFHGTGVASLLAASADNDVCAAGIAPDVTLSACTFGEDYLPDQFVDMLESQLEKVDISSNSWGPEVCTNLNFVRRSRKLATNADGTCMFDKKHEYSPCGSCKGQGPEELSARCTDAINEYCTYYYQNDPVACAEFLDIYISCEYHSLPDAAHKAFVRGVMEGRQGKGIVYVYAGGNSHEYGAFTNTDGYVNSRFTIAVGAVGRQGLHASYSTTGSALHVTAPGGDFDAVANNVVAKAGGGCEDIPGGTSFSAPVVSGVIALMLQVNPELGWRDVQWILAQTSQHVDTKDNSWMVNAAGLHHSYKYGFGIVDAAAAVQAARNWTNAGPEEQWIWSSQNGPLSIADDTQLPTIDILEVEASESFVMESVVLYLDLQHASRGDLLITLTSPSGMESILHPSKRPENRQLGSNETWKLATVRNWGENPAGEWKLTVVDESKGIHGNCANELFEHLYLNEATGRYEAYTCLDVEERLHCWNGQVKHTELLSQYVDQSRNNRTAAEACCICGGGTPVSDVNLLKSWTMVVYGHGSVLNSDGDNVDEDVTTVTAAMDIEIVETVADAVDDGDLPPLVQAEDEDEVASIQSAPGDPVIGDLLIVGLAPPEDELDPPEPETLQVGDEDNTEETGAASKTTAPVVATISNPHENQSTNTSKVKDPSSSEPSSIDQPNIPVDDKAKADALAIASRFQNHEEDDEDEAELNKRPVSQQSFDQQAAEALGETEKEQVKRLASSAHSPQCSFGWAIVALVTVQWAKWVC